MDEYQSYRRLFLLLQVLPLSTSSSSSSSAAEETTLWLKKVPTFKLSILCQISIDFQNFCTAGKQTKFATTLVQHYQLTIGMVLRDLGKLKIQIFCRCGRKLKQNAFLVACNFDIHPQILIISVFKILNISPYWLQIKLSMLVCFYLHVCSFTIKLWHRKFVTADVSAVFINNQHGIQRRRQDFDLKSLYLKGTQKRGWQTNFLRKVGQSVVLISWWKRCGTQACAVDRHFVEENKSAFVCLNISNILLTHKYTRHTQLHE